LPGARFALVVDRFVDFAQSGSRAKESLKYNTLARVVVR
jgi:hypothetical protein